MPANDSPFAIALYIVTAAFVLACVYLYWPRRDRDASRHSHQLSTSTPTRVIAARVALWDTLTPREQEVARLAARGYMDAEIARALTIESTTVRAHMRQVRRKLGIHSRHQLRAIVRYLPPEHADAGPPQDTG